MNNEQQYTVVRKLGSGAYGNVFEVKTSDHDTYAIKVYADKLGGLLELATLFAADLHPNIIGLRKYTCSLDRRPLKTITGSNRHRNDPDGIKLDETCDLALFIQLGARDLRAYPADEIDTDKLYLDMASALTHLHARNIIHGDVKPENILWNRAENRFCLVDFSLSEFYCPHNTLENTISTLHYRAPEVVAKRDIRPDSDWFSLGMTILEIINNKRPIRVREDKALKKAHNAMYAQYPDLAARPQSRAPPGPNAKNFFTLERGDNLPHLMHLLHEIPSRRFRRSDYDAVMTQWNLRTNPGPGPRGLTDYTRSGIFRSNGAADPVKRQLYRDLLAKKMPTRIFWQILYVINRSVDPTGLDLDVLRVIYENIFYRDHIEIPAADVLRQLGIMRNGIVFRTPYECGFGRKMPQRDVIEKVHKIFFMRFNHF